MLFEKIRFTLTLGLREESDVGVLRVRVGFRPVVRFPLCKAGPALLVLLASLSASIAVEARESSGSSRDPMVLTDNGDLYLRARIEATNGVFASSGTWFGLAGLVPTANFKESRVWGESWLEPGIDATLRVSSAFELYGGLSAGASKTWDSDPFEQLNRGSLSFENAFGGIRTRNPTSSWNIDISAGQQNYGVGTGMLIWQGAGNGFERGAVSLLPRQAWSNATVARLTFAGFGLEGFYLDPNELKSADTRTKLAGFVAQYRWGQTSRVGVSGLRVLKSEQFYPLPSATLTTFAAGIPNGREGLQALNGYAEIEGANFGVPNAWLRGEFTLERNDRINMRAQAYYGEVGYRFASLNMTPALSYAYARFSGDDPSTARYERFDPLFYGNGMDNWWFGAANAYAFLNSNTANHRATLRLTASQQDFLKFQYIHTRANELFSPVQFGQATRVAFNAGGIVLVNGVANQHLSDEAYAEWAHIFDKNTSLALWMSVARPGQGIRALPGVDAKTWLIAGLLFTLKY